MRKTLTYLAALGVATAAGHWFIAQRDYLASEVHDLRIRLDRAIALAAKWQEAPGRGVVGYGGFGQELRSAIQDELEDEACPPSDGRPIDPGCCKACEMGVMRGFARGQVVDVGDRMGGERQ